MSSVWGSIVSDYQRSPKATVIRKAEEKKCVACQTTKPITEFYNRPARGPDSFSSRCCDCLRAYQKEKRILKKKEK